MRQLSFKRHRFPPDIIRHSICLYARFTLSYRDVEEMLAERDLDISYETVRRWFLKFGSTIAANLRRARPRPAIIGTSMKLRHEGAKEELSLLKTSSAKFGARCSGRR